MDIKPDIVNVTFFDSRSYDTFTTKGLLIYCDPPYFGNKLGNSSSFFQIFDHKHFWNVMRYWSKNNLVIVSESTAPKDFKKIWSSNSTASNTSGTKIYKDNLYIYQDLHRQINKKIINKIKEI